jgi:hypothetical protein
MFFETDNFIYHYIMDFLYVLTWLFIWGVYGNLIKILKISPKKHLVISLIGLLIIYKKTNCLKKFDN